MKLLLDTHVLLWWLTGDPRLSEPLHALIRNREHAVHLSAVSVLEIAIKTGLGRLSLPVSAEELAADVLAEDGFVPLPVTIRHAAEVERLPPLHRDPFDRLLVAQARAEGMTLLSADPQVAAYEVAVVG